MHGRAARAVVLGSVSVAAVAVLLAGVATSERDAPVVGVDGKWHAGPDWTVEAGDDLVYAGVSLVAPGNLTIESDARLVLVNSTLDFEGDGAPRSIGIDGGGRLRLEGVTLTAEIAAFRVNAGQGTLDCARSDLRLGAPGDGASGVVVLEGWLFASVCRVAAGGVLALNADGATVATADSGFERLDGSPADIRLAGQGSYTLESTTLGALHSDGRATVTLYANVTFHLRSPAGEPLDGTVNGSTAGPRYFFANADVYGTAGPVKLLWMVLDPAPTLQPPEFRVSAPVVVTGVGYRAGGNTTTFAIDRPRLDLDLVLDKPFNLGLYPPAVQGGEVSKSGPRAFYVGLNSTHAVVVAVSREGNETGRDVTVRVRMYQADPLSFAPHSAFIELDPLTLPAGANPLAHPLSFDHTFGPWGTHVHREGPCYSTDQYYAVLEFHLEVTDEEDYGPWNNTVTVGVIAFLVEGDPEQGCTTGAGTGGLLVAGAAVGSVGAALALGYYLSPAREARRAARRGPPPPRGPP
jgi:hypothetical protein